MRFFLVSAAGLAILPSAFAQQAVPDPAQLARTVSCASAEEARTGLQTAVDQALAGSTRQAVVSALNQLSADPTVCAPVRDAATGLAGSIVDASALAASKEIAAASGAIIEATLAEADRRAANLKFKVGPPPRNMTRGREGS